MGPHFATPPLRHGSRAKWIGYGVKFQAYRGASKGEASKLLVGSVAGTCPGRIDAREEGPGPTPRVLIVEFSNEVSRNRYTRLTLVADECDRILMTAQPVPDPKESFKQRHARLCESDLANHLLGTSLPPGRLELTERLGTLLHLTPKSRVLDVASRKGAMSIFLAKRFKCYVVGFDHSSQNVTHAIELAVANGLASRVRFHCGDAKHIPFPDASFDAVVCDCAFWTFPNKSNTAREFARVLRTGGRIGLSDFTRGEMLPKELDYLFASIPCVADAQPIASYVEYFRSANFDLEKVEFHSAALTELVHQIRIKLLRAKNLVALKQLALPGVDFASIKQMAQGVLAAVEKGQLDYVILVALKSLSRRR